MLAAVRCVCAQPSDIADRLIAAAGLDAPVLDAEVDRGDWQYRASVDLLYEWAARLEPAVATLSGPSGAGKTRLAKATVTRLALAGARPRYLSWPDFERRLRSYMSNDNGREWIALRAAHEHEALCVDNVYLGRMRQGYARSTFEDLVIQRSDRELPTLYVTSEKWSDDGSPMLRRLTSGVSIQLRLSR